MQTVTTPDRIRIAYDVRGDGPALMLIHGGGGSHLEWYDGGYVERLSGSFKVIAVDLRGHGQSDQPGDPACYVPELLSQDLLAVADACDSRRFSLWGYSFGGNVSRYLTARSERVARFVMIGSHFGPGVTAEGLQLALDFRARWTPIVQRFFADHPKHRFDPQFLSWVDQEEIERLSFPGEMLPGVLAWSSAMLTWPVNRPADMRCSTLWLFGSKNESAMRSYLEYQNGLQQIQVQVDILEGLDHEQEFSDIEQVLPRLVAFTLAGQ